MQVSCEFLEGDGCFKALPSLGVATKDLYFITHLTNLSLTADHKKTLVQLGIGDTLNSLHDLHAMLDPRRMYTLCFNNCCIARTVCDFAHIKCLQI